VGEEMPQRRHEGMVRVELQRTGPGAGDHAGDGLLVRPVAVPPPATSGVPDGLADNVADGGADTR